MAAIRHWIQAPKIPRITSQEAPYDEGGPFGCAMSLDRLETIRRTTRVKPARGTNDVRDGHAIAHDQTNQDQANKGKDRAVQALMDGTQDSHL